MAQGRVRALIGDAISGFATGDLNRVLDRVVSSLNVASLSAAASVPRLDGADAVRLEVATSLTSVALSGARAL